MTNSMKYADDSYVIVPSSSSNADTRSAELSNVEAWARRNNLKLNQTKSVEVTFTVRKRSQQALPPRGYSNSPRFICKDTWRDNI